MKITVILYATLRRYVPDGKENSFELELNPKSTTRAGAVLECLGIPANVAAVMLINGRHANYDKILSDGDTVVLYPTISGG